MTSIKNPTEFTEAFREMDDHFGDQDNKEMLAVMRLMEFGYGALLDLTSQHRELVKITALQKQCLEGLVTALDGAGNRIYSLEQTVDVLKSEHLTPERVADAVRILAEDKDGG